jgi:RND family efflux transporter MFP subunit
MIKPSLITVVALSALSALPACGKKEEAGANSTATPFSVRVETVRIEPIRSSLMVTGTIAPTPGADWTISSPEPGRVADLPKPVGAAVKEGDVIVRFEIPTLDAELANWQSQVSLASSRLDAAKKAATRATDLGKGGLLPQRDIDAALREQTDAQVTLSAAQAGFQVAQLAASRATVKARFSGVVATLFHNVGDLVSGTSADPVVRVIDPTRLEVVATITAADLVRVSPGRPARIMIGAEGIIDGAVVTVPAPQAIAAPAGDVRISLLKPTTQLVGTPVSVEILTEESNQALVIPMTALLRDGDLPYVLVAGDDGRAHKKGVSLGIVTREKVQVVSGLVAGEKVILASADPPGDGSPIVIEK